MKKNLAIFILPAVLAVFAAAPAIAQVRVGVQAGPVGVHYAQDAPPRARSEKRPPRPSPQHQWVAGYYERQNDQWAWSAGRWEQPSESGNHWIKPKYHHEKAGYRYEEGRWAK